MARNMVVSGDYSGSHIQLKRGDLWIVNLHDANIALNKTNVMQYNILNSDQRKSAASGVLRGAAGAVVLGPVGLLAGLSAKNKGTYSVEILFRSGRHSLIEIDEKFYKVLMEKCF